MNAKTLFLLSLFSSVIVQEEEESQHSTEAAVRQFRGAAAEKPAKEAAVQPAGGLAAEVESCVCMSAVAQE